MEIVRRNRRALKLGAAVVFLLYGGAARLPAQYDKVAAL
jgi:hypothetical protein